MNWKIFNNDLLYAKKDIKHVPVVSRWITDQFFGKTEVNHEANVRDGD